MPARRSTVPAAAAAAGEAAAPVLGDVLELECTDLAFGGEVSSCGPAP